MRTLFTLLFLTILLTGCASVEPVAQQEEEEVSSETRSFVPEWYNPLVASVSDSVSVHGFALASATDSIEAVLLAENSALNNLRYEIDVMAETTRELLVENNRNTPYSEASFIIKLRNTVRDLPLSNTTVEIETYRSGNSIFHAYAKASLPKNSLWDIISDHLDDSEFAEAIKSSSAE